MTDTPNVPAAPPALGGLPVEARAIVGQVIMGFRREMAKHMEAVTLELRALSNDNSVMRQNLGLLNAAMADFQRLQVIPLRESLEQLREEQGSTTVENARKLEALIQALAKSLDAAGGLIPADLKQQIKDGRFENLEHRPEGSMVDFDRVQAMIEEAYARGRADGTAGVNR